MVQEEHEREQGNEQQNVMESSAASFSSYAMVLDNNSVETQIDSQFNYFSYLHDASITN